MHANLESTLSRAPAALLEVLVRVQVSHPGEWPAHDQWRRMAVRLPVK